ncbi:Arf-GAP with coiled-coil, ANK repeat and PH domain-containing protein 3 [Merluccius polli]|uniref:Arf-GAP with coiled-coil, ANK repeat and PH domain-containing protein 3 n=1 Tax=Merluccius polli TaxID=89951 RepID=A0AA47N3A4_MERPO|nr:Arf-GAP with coiled-coil, ANK repeat and PH domain-containing protein 3 [Merluccius polli]
MISKDMGTRHSFLLGFQANIDEVESEVVEIEAKLDKLVKLCSGMIEAGKAYVSANKLFVNGIRDLSQQCKKDEMISFSAGKRWIAPSGFESELLLQAKEFKYLGILFTSEGEMDRWIGAESAVMLALYRAVVVKRELSRKAKLSIYQSIYVPTLNEPSMVMSFGQ